MEELLKRKESESDFEYKVRICLLKLDRQINLDWFEIVELLGLECSSDHLRKLSYGYKEYHDYIEQNPTVTSEDERLAELRAKINELEIVKIQVADEKRMLRAIQREEARRRTLKETILDRIDRLNHERPMLSNEVKECHSKKTECVMLSDLHYGNETKSYMNCYSTEIAKDRLNQYKDRVVRIAKKDDVEKINIELLGDLIENALHVTARIDNERNTAQQVVECAELISEFIYNIAIETKLPIDVYEVDGNHDRITIKKEEALTGDSFNYIIDAMLRMRLREVKNVKFIENTYRPDIAIMKVYNKTIALVHGHHDKKNNARNNLNDFLKGEEYIDVVHMGHYHQFEVNRGNCIINGSVKGSDNYSLDLRYSSKPQQMIVVYGDDEEEVVHRITLK